MGIVDLDALAKKTKTIKIRSKKYEIEQPSINLMTQHMRRVGDENLAKESPDAFLEELVQSIIRAVPGISEETVKDLSMPVINRLVDEIYNVNTWNLEKNG